MFLVSHGLGIIRQTCTRAIWLEAREDRHRRRAPTPSSRLTKTDTTPSGRPSDWPYCESPELTPCPSRTEFLRNRVHSGGLRATGCRRAQTESGTGAAVRRAHRRRGPQAWTIRLLSPWSRPRRLETVPRGRANHHDRHVVRLRARRFGVQHDDRGTDPAVLRLRGHRRVDRWPDDPGRASHPTGSRLLPGRRHLPLDLPQVRTASSAARPRVAGRGRTGDPGRARSAAGGWQTYLLWRHATPLHATDPLFHKDISFFVEVVSVPPAGGVAALAGRHVRPVDRRDRRLLVRGVAAAAGTPEGHQAVDPADVGAAGRIPGAQGRATTGCPATRSPPRTRGPVTGAGTRTSTRRCRASTS